MWKKSNYIFGALELSFFIMVSVFIVSAGGVVLILDIESLVIESFIATLSALLPVDFWELQPAATDPIIAAAMAKLKICFFIVML